MRLTLQLGRSAPERPSAPHSDKKPSSENQASLPIVRGPPLLHSQLTLSRSTGRHSAPTHRVPIRRTERRDMGRSSVYVPSRHRVCCQSHFPRHRHAHADGAHAGHRPACQRCPAQRALPALRRLLRGRVCPLRCGTRVSVFISGGRLIVFVGQAPNIITLIVGRAIAGIGSSGYALLTPPRIYEMLTGNAESPSATLRR